MTLPMIIALAVTVLMIILIMVDKLPFGAPPLLALLLLVVFGVTDIKTAFGGFANPTIVMLASFMAIIAALQKTSFIVKFKQTMLPQNRIAQPCHYYYWHYAFYSVYY